MNTILATNKNEIRDQEHSLFSRSGLIFDNSFKSLINSVGKDKFYGTYVFFTIWLAFALDNIFFYIFVGNTIPLIQWLTFFACKLVVLIAIAYVAANIRSFLGNPTSLKLLTTDHVLSFIFIWSSSLLLISVFYAFLTNLFKPLIFLINSASEKLGEIGNLADKIPSVVTYINYGIYSLAGILILLLCLLMYRKLNQLNTFIFWLFSSAVIFLVQLVSFFAIY